MSKTVVFIHDAWLTPAAWDRFAGRYTACGYTCTAPSWPLLDQPIARLQQAPPAALASLRIADILDHYETLIRACVAAPLLVGHGFGGMFVQMLLDRGLGAAGIAIAPVPPGGIFPGWLALRHVAPMLLPWRRSARLLPLTFSQFGRSFAQTLAPSERQAAYRAHVIAAPAGIFEQAALGMDNQVDFYNDYRPPLLFIAAEHDRMVKAAIVASCYKRHRGSTAVTDFMRFPGRSHWLINEAGWEEVADAGIEWSQIQSGRF